MVREHDSRIVWWGSHVAWQLDQLVSTGFGSGWLLHTK